MKPFLQLCLAVVLGAAAAQAQTNSVSATAPAAEPNRADFGRAQFGGAGLLRVQSASIVERSLSFSAQAGFFREDALTASGTDEYHLAIVGAAFSPLPALELSATSRSATLT